MVISVGTYPTHDKPTIEIVEGIEEFSPDLLSSYPIETVNSEKEIQNYITKYGCDDMEKTYSLS